ncbi:MAG: hypothetical protein RLY31_2200 [Bacteroidota bacterium]|jgi:amidohydrolase
MIPLKQQINRLSVDLFPQVRSFRRHLHQHPELSFEEFETGRFVAAQLQAMGVAFETGWGNTGVVALIQGNRSDSGQVVALRADIDALPIQEANRQLSYASQQDGVMHACGHDVHTACLLGAAAILHTLRHSFEGTVKLIFQPAEEKLPGGASRLIREGVLQNPTPRSIFGQHVLPELPAGMVGFRPGMYMASADELYLTVHGKGGHGAMPHQCVDTVLLAAHIVVALQQVVSRNSHPLVPSVLTFGNIRSEGGATNIIPDSLRLEGTFRTMDEQWRDTAHQLIRQIAEGVAHSMGGHAVLDIVKGYPCLENDASLTLRARQWAVDFLGADKVTDLPMRMTSEDFAWYASEIPACFFRLGSADPTDGKNAPLHSDKFDVDESCLVTGMGLISWLAIMELMEAAP